ncbi:MAG: MFS transporter [Rickettsiales bacterium]
MLFLRKLYTNKLIRHAYLAWFVISLFYLYQYILRVTPGVIVDNMRAFFHITAEEFATLGALYLLGYSLLQIPLGIIVDRIGVKKMCLYSIAICIMSSLLFTATQHFWLAQLSRFIMGVGSASAFMCALKFTADHFPPGNRGFLMGATLALGTVGALISGKSVAYVKEHSDWHDVMVFSAGVGTIVFILIAWLVKPHQSDAVEELKRKSIREIAASIWEIVRNKNIMIYAVLALGLYTPLSALADLWGTAFLKQKYSLSRVDAAEISQSMYIGLTMGSLFLPWIAEKFHKLNQAIIFCSFGILTTFSYLLYGPTVDSTTLVFLLILLGFFCGAEMMCFTGALFHSQKFDSGEIIGVVNTLNMLGGAVLQQLIGWGLDKQWLGLTDDMGIRQYTTEQYVTSLNALLIVITFCCIISFSLIGRPMKVHEI